MQLVLRTFDLPLKQRFTIARGSLDSQPTVIVELSDGQHSGYGEATSNSYYGVTIESLLAVLEAARPAIESAEWDEPTELWQQLQPQLAEHPFALCAVDQAAHDLWGKRLDKFVFELWGLTLDRAPVSNFTIGIDTVETMIAKLQAMPAWPIYKIKLGTPDDLEIVRALRDQTDSIFRVDANCSWSVERTLELAPQLQALGIELIEQPLPADDWQGMQRLFRESVLPIFADESCQTEADIERCAGHFHGVNIKLVKCGGLTPARRMIARARQLGLQTMVGCMTESTVGISAIAQLLPLLDYVDMDGAALLAQDIATGVRVERGRAIFPHGAGCGVRLLNTSLPGP